MIKDSDDSNAKLPNSVHIANSTAGEAKGILVVIKIYDVNGLEVITLVNEEKSAGGYKINFNGSELSSGVYFYKLEAKDLYVLI